MTSSDTVLRGANQIHRSLEYCVHCGHKLVGTYHAKIYSQGESVYKPMYRCYNRVVLARKYDDKRRYSAARIEEAEIRTVLKYFSTFNITIFEPWKEQAKVQVQRKQSFNIKQAELELSKLQNRQSTLDDFKKAFEGDHVEGVIIREFNEQKESA